MLGELFAAPMRSTGVALTGGLATAIVGGTAPWIEQMLVNAVASDAAPGIYVAGIAGLALVALRSWPETASSDLD
jgi:MHS family proline/betaine transporter-like MFS transporter